MELYSLDIRCNNLGRLNGILVFSTLVLGGFFVGFQKLIGRLTTEPGGTDEIDPEELLPVNVTDPMRAAQLLLDQMYLHMLSDY